jgi:hypothetical protein
VALALGAVDSQAQDKSSSTHALPMQLAGAWKGDFDGMMERRVIRVLVPYSRTLYFNDAGHERGSRRTTSATSSATSIRSTESESASGHSPS